MGSLKDAAKYLPLSEAIQTLKSELLRADAAAKAGNSALLELTQCEIELAVEFKPTAELGFDIYVFKVKAGAEASGTHRIKVTYKPIGIPIQAPAVDTSIYTGAIPSKKRAKRRQEP